MAVEYKEKIGYRGTFLIYPYYNGFEGSKEIENCEEMKRYVWDAMSCLCFLKHYNLDRYYKLSVNPGHQLYVANV